MKLQRILQMSHTEIIYRSRQKVSKSIEQLAMTASVNSHQSPCLFDQLKSGHMLSRYKSGMRAGNVAEAERLLQDNFYIAANSSFFDGVINEDTADQLMHDFPELHRQVVDMAESVCNGRFNILGYGKVDFGNPVAWSLDPVNGHQVALVHWSRIDPLDPQMVGDSKVIWELNRHQWMVDLGQAYQFTGNEKYAEAFATYIKEWMKANPPGLGINWSSSLEVAMRLISWSWALMFFRHAKVMTTSLFMEMMAWTGLHAAYIERYLSSYYSPNTHLTGEALGLYYAGVLCPEFRGADRWRKLGQQILEDQIERQVYVDGVYFEQSTRYQYYTVEIYLHYLILATKNQETIPVAMITKVQQMLDFLLRVRQPDGAVPQIGDADGGCLLPLVQRTPADYRGLFSTAAVFFKRDDYAWAAKGLAPETVWLLGNAAPQIYESLLPAPPDTPASHLYPYGGYTVIRNDWKDDAHHMIFDTGPLGCPYSSGHGHADLLGIQCSVFGHPYLVDPGTYCYTGNKKWRNYFRSSFAHNTVVVDGTSQTIPEGPFSWKKKIKATLRRWIVTEDSVLVDADHDAYQDLADPVSHRRRVLFVNSQYWVVVDDLDGHAQHLLELTWQFAALDVSFKAESWVEAAGQQGHGLRLRSFSSVPLQANLYRGSHEPVRGWISPDYGQLIAAPQLVYTVNDELPVRIVTLLLPARDLSVTPPLIVQKMNGRTMILELDGGRETIVINDHDILVKAANIDEMHQHRVEGSGMGASQVAVATTLNDYQD